MKSLFGIGTVLIGVVLSSASLGAHSAALARIQMSGADIVYFERDGTICDAGGGAAAAGVCQGGADTLGTMTFSLGGVGQGTYTSPANSIGFNMLLSINRVDPTTSVTTAVLSSSSDVFDAQIGGVPGLFSDVDSGSVNFTSTALTLGGSGIAGIAAGFPPVLPFGLMPEGPLAWSFSGESASCTGDIGSRICTYSGNAEISWTQQSGTQQVPEPATLLLAGVSLLGLAFTRRRKSR
jgi:hypothetical protein